MTTSSYKRQWPGYGQKKIQRDKMKNIDNKYKYKTIQTTTGLVKPSSSPCVTIIVTYQSYEVVAACWLAEKIYQNMVCVGQELEKEWDEKLQSQKQFQAGTIYATTCDLLRHRVIFFRLDLLLNCVFKNRGRPTETDKHIDFIPTVEYMDQGRYSRKAISKLLKYKLSS